MFCVLAGWREAGRHLMYLQLARLLAASAPFVTVQHRLMLGLLILHRLYLQKS